MAKSKKYFRYNLSWNNSPVGIFRAKDNKELSSMLEEDLDFIVVSSKVKERHNDYWLGDIVGYYASEPNIHVTLNYKRTRG